MKLNHALIREYFADFLVRILDAVPREVSSDSLVDGDERLLVNHHLFFEGGKLGNRQQYPEVAEIILG